MSCVPLGESVTTRQDHGMEKRSVGVGVREGKIQEGFPGQCKPQLFKANVIFPLCCGDRALRPKRKNALVIGKKQNNHHLF